MKHNQKFNIIICYVSLFLFIISSGSLKGQQLDSPPVITLINPSSSDSLNNSGLSLVKAEIVSYSPLSSISIISNETKVANETGLKPQKKDNNTYTIESLVPLQKGLNIIYIKAKNSKGISSSQKRNVYCHAEPFVTWILPSSGISTSYSDLFTVKAEIRSDLELKNISLNINGTNYPQEAEGLSHPNNNTWIFEKKIQLKTGKNSIYISSNNIKGTTNSTIRVINNSTGSPIITLISPDIIDSLNNSGLGLVRAQIISKSDLQTISIFNSNDKAGINETTINPAKKDSTTYNVESLIPLYAGINTIYVEAKNPAGASVSEKRKVICQPEPFIRWITPSSLTTTSDSETPIIKAEIKTDYDIKNISINLNGTAIAQDLKAINRINNNTYILENKIQLKAGKNSVFIATTNLKGTASSSTRIINNSFGTPIITLTSPIVTDSLNNLGLALVKATVFSKTELQSITILINTEKKGDIETSVVPQKKESSTYIIESLVPLEEGLNNIYLLAKNSVASVTSEKRRIICQPQPFITWILPVSANSNSESEIITVKAEIKTDIDLKNISLNLNGVVLSQETEGITRLNNNTYILERKVQLKTGKNSIYIAAGNIKGIANSSIRMVTNTFGSAPVITLTNPSSTDSLNNTGLILVRAEISSKSGLQTFRVFNNKTLVASGTAEMLEHKDSATYILKNLVPLQAGMNTVYVEVKNSIGSATSEKHIIKCQLEPIINWILPSSVSSTTGSGKLDIKAEVLTNLDLLNASINLNGNIISLKKEGIPRLNNNTYSIETTLTLNPGLNTIVILGSNPKGTVSSSNRSITYVPEIVAETKKVTPSVQANNPGTSAVTPSNNTVPTTTKSANNQASTTTKPVNNPVSAASLAVSNPDAAPVLSANIPIPAAPAVIWVSPSMEKNNINMNSARIKASIKSIDKLKSLLVYVNGVATEEVTLIPQVGPQGDYSLEKTINLQPGENDIYLVATNLNGTTKSENRYLTNPPANPPVISWTNPIDPKAIVNSEVVVIEACIKSATELKLAQIFVNGVQQASEMMFQPSQPGECNYRFTKPVILKEGDNSLIVIATNFAGSVNSDQRVIRFEKATMVEKRLALVLGNSDYGSSNVLKNPVNDANLIEGTLKSLGFNVIKRINATKTEMYEALREFSKLLPEYNVALLYYAGHGVQVDGQNYLVPTDAKLNEPADCKWEAMKVNDVVEEFEKVPENINIIILDACRNNPFRSWSRGGAQGFRTINSVSGTIISFATAEGSTAADGAGSNGTFTEELVKQMNIPQSLSSVFNNTRKQVMKRTNNQQRPLEMNGLTGDFYFKK